MSLFGWCGTGQHERCMVTNAGSTCSCKCENHGTEYGAPALTKEQQNVRSIAEKAIASEMVAQVNKVDLRKKNNEPTLTYEQALAKVQAKKADKKPDATTLEELKKSR